jgi:hypothetical protein
VHVIAVVFSAALVQASDAVSPDEWRPRLEPYSVERHVFVLRDGLRVVVEQHANASAIRVVSRITGGRVAEPAAGAAWHGVDLWRGAAVRPGLDVTTAYALVGAGLDITVSPETTLLVVEGPASAAETVLGLERARGSEEWLAVAPDHRSPSMPAWADERDGAWLGPLFDAIYPEEHPYNGMYGTGSSREHAEAWIRTTWRPDRTTVVVSSPLAPRRVLCSLVGAEACLTDVLGARPVEAEHVVSADLDAAPAGGSELWMRPLSPPRSTDLEHARFPVASPVLLVGWSGPGSDARLGGLPVEQFVDAGVRWVEDQLRDAISEDHVRRTRCWWIDGDASGTTVCALFLRHGAPIDRVGRRVTRGVGTRGLAEHLEAWRGRARADSISALDDPSGAVQLATHFARTGRTTLHTDRLDAVNAVDLEILRSMVLSVYGPRRAARVLVEDARE